MNNQTAFLIVAAILLTAVVSIALFDSKAANAQGNITSGAKNMTGGAAKMTKNQLQAQWVQQLVQERNKSY